MHQYVDVFMRDTRETRVDGSGKRIEPGVLIVVVDQEERHGARGHGVLQAALLAVLGLRVEELLHIWVLGYDRKDCIMKLLQEIIQGEIIFLTFVRASHSLREGLVGGMGCTDTRKDCVSYHLHLVSRRMGIASCERTSYGLNEHVLHISVHVIHKVLTKFAVETGECRPEDCC